MAASLQAVACATLLLVLVPHACTAAKTTLEDSCERYAGGERSSNDYKYCVRTLQRADKKSSATADARALGRIAARLAWTTASATRAKIVDTLAQRNETLPRALRDSLAACDKEYAAAVRRIGHAAKAIRQAADEAGSRDGHGHVQSAQKLLALATGTPERCGAAFAAAGQDSPLADWDFALDDQIGLASNLLPPPWELPSNLLPPPRPSPPASAG